MDGRLSVARLKSSLVTQQPVPEARPPATRDVEYKGGPLDAEKGPGLGCFWLQVVVLAIAVVLTPLSAAWEWPVIVTIVLMAITLVLLLFVGQTVIFLLRLVAADRRTDGRRRPIRSATRTVGELEDEATAVETDAVDETQDAEAPAESEGAAGARNDEPG
jgi:hypothetical protein